MGKIFANNTADKGFISKIYKEFLQVNNKETSDPIKKMDKRFKYFSKDI